MVFGKTGNGEHRIDYDRMMKYRLERAREMMNKYGLGALITWDEVNARYIAGGGGHNEDSYVIFPRNGDPYNCGAMAGRPQTPGRKSLVIASPKPCDTVTKEEFQNLVREVTNIMEEHGIRNETIAVDGTASGVLLQEALRDAGINAIFDNRVMAEARLIKNQDEIECLKIACANADKVFAVFKDKIKPGLTEGDLMAIGTDTLLVGLGQDGMTMGALFTIASGERTNPPQRLFTDRLIRPGELVLIDPHNAFQGYEACCWRTFCCGKATAEQKEIYAEARDILYEGLSAVKAGSTALDVIEKWPSDPRRYGADNWEEIEFLVSGHGLGLARGSGYPGIGRWVDYPRRFHPGLPKDMLEKIVFEENMTLALETWNGRSGGKDGVYIEQDIVVTKDGYELLTKFPMDELTECWT